MEKIDLPRARDMGQTVGDPFLFARQNFRLLVTSYLYYVVPPLLVAVALSAFGIKSVLGGRSLASLSSLSYDRDALVQMGIALALAYGIFILISLFQQVYITEFMVLKESRDEVNNEDVLHQLKKDWKNIVGTFLFLIPLGVLAIILIVMVIKSSQYVGAYVAGFVAFLLYLFFLYSTIPLASLLFIRLREKLSLTASLAKAFSITSGNWWRTFSAWFIVFMIIYSLLYAVTLPAYYTVMFLNLHKLASGNQAAAEAFMGSIIGVGATVGSFAFFFVMNVLHVFIGVSYFSLSEKYDNYNLRAQIEKIGVREENNIRKQEGEY